MNSKTLLLLALLVFACLAERPGSKLKFTDAEPAPSEEDPKEQEGVAHVPQHVVDPSVESPVAATAATLDNRDGEECWFRTIGLLHSQCVKATDKPQTYDDWVAAEAPGKKKDGTLASEGNCKYFWDKYDEAFDAITAANDALEDLNAYKRKVRDGEGEGEDDNEDGEEEYVNIYHSLWDLFHNPPNDVEKAGKFVEQWAENVMKHMMHAIHKAVKDGDLEALTQIQEDGEALATAFSGLVGEDGALSAEGTDWNRWACCAAKSSQDSRLTARCQNALAKVSNCLGTCSGYLLTISAAVLALLAILL